MESNDTSNNEDNTTEESDDIDVSNLADGETDSEA